MEDDISTAEVSMGFGSKKIMASDIYRNYCCMHMGNASCALAALSTTAVTLSSRIKSASGFVRADSVCAIDACCFGNALYFSHYDKCP